MSTPAPTTIAARLRALANTLDDHGNHAQELADALASNGYPTATGGNGSRSADETTSVERAAGTNNDTTRKPTRWDHANTDLARLLDVTNRTARATNRYITDLLAHASDEDMLPAGTGFCLCCDNFIRPDHKHPERRLKAGYCPACHQAWLRWRQTHHPDRGQFVHDRRIELLRLADEREAKRRQKQQIGA